MKKTFLWLIATFITATTFAQAPDDWYHQDPADGYNGVSVDRTYNTLLKDRASQTVVVAIIDSGMDIEHEDLADNIWINTDEIPDNGIDDDKNGYIDDVYGWNFIGGADGSHVGGDNLEVTRLYAKYRGKYGNVTNPESLSKKDKKNYEKFLVYKEEVEKNRAKAEKRIARTDSIGMEIRKSVKAVSVALDTNVVSVEALSTLDPESNPDLGMAMRILPRFMEPGAEMKFDDIYPIIDEALEGDKKYWKSQLKYHYNPDLDTREIVGDDYRNSKERYYGNNDVEGPDALHGTHVGGIVGAVRDNGIGVQGVADNVKLMSIRTVPDGDERDKDVANAIRYAVDNGASIINMSFGKGFSWDKDIVDEAVKYATKKDVLLVHAAGNSAQNNDNTGNFPNDKYNKRDGWWIFKKDKKSKVWIEVGALNFEKEDKLPALFSNYGAENVDVFAPGVQIYNTLPDNGYRKLQGTSMAAPVVAGVAAVLRSYFPTLTAEQVKEIIMSTAIKQDVKVMKPGTEELVPFSELSVTGGVINMYNAVQKAMQTKGKKKIKRKKRGA